MRLIRLVLSLLSSSLILFGCSQTPAARAPSLATRPAASDYVTVAPSVSVSKTAEEAPQKQASLAPNEDVMAEILAIPPGG